MIYLPQAFDDDIFAAVTVNTWETIFAYLSDKLHPGEKLWSIELPFMLNKVGRW